MKLALLALAFVLGACARPSSTIVRDTETLAGVNCPHGQAWEKCLAHLEKVRGE